jgi:methylated-DNA-protein-cysteine methyltransferase-like protein
VKRSPESASKLKRRILRDGLKPNEERDSAIRAVIRSIPRGKVSTYSAVAAAAGYPMYHRLVARILGKSGDSLPWQRVVGVGGEIKLRMGSALEQRQRLEMEGVRFRGRRVDMERCEAKLKPWEIW